MKPINAKVQTENRFGGMVCLAKTDRGNDVHVWSPPEVNLPAAPLLDSHDPRVQQAHNLVLGIGGASARGMLFCHGHAFDTFQKYGYSIYGGPPLEQVLKDEYALVATQSLVGARAGDIIVWRRDKNIVHSAKLEIVPVKNATTATTKVSSKDTYSGFSHKWLSEYLTEWKNDWKIYRHV